MHIKNQARAAIIGTIFFLVCFAGIARAEGETPVPSPDASVPLPAVAAEQIDQPAPSATPAPTVAEADSNLETPTETPAETPTPDVAYWLPIVNSLQPGYWEPSILPVEGIAMYYNPGVFQQVMDFRFKNHHISECDQCIGHVALLRGGDLDRRVWLQRQGQRMEGPFWVVDAAAFKHIPTLLSRDWVVDVDHDTAMRWRMAGPVPVTVYDANSPEAQAAAAAQLSAAQTYALVGFLYKCAFLPLETHSYQVLAALADSANCLTSSQAGNPPAQGAADSVGTESTGD